MDRPVMDPTYAKDLIAPAREPLWLRAWHASQPVLRVLKIALRVLVWNPLTRKADASFRNEDGRLWQRIARAVFYRLAFVPVMIAMVVAMFVWSATHPQHAAASVDPNSAGIYYETIQFPSPNRPPCRAWLVPQVDAKKVIEEGEKSLRKKYPAVVLVPDCGHGADQLLSLIKPLHKAGFIVLSIHSPSVSNLRSRGVTFGLREAQDVQSAVVALRARAMVDPSRIAILGVGGGANAALLAAQRDPSLRTIIIDQPHESYDAIRGRLSPDVTGLGWMSPLCKWSFELSYQVDAEELDLANFDKVFETRRVLKLRTQGSPEMRADERTTSIVGFLSAHLLE